MREIMDEYHRTVGTLLACGVVAAAATVYIALWPIDKVLRRAGQ